MERCWKRSSAFVVALTISAVLAAQGLPGNGLELPFIGDSDIILKYSGFTVRYNSERLVPDWVAYEITADEAYGEVPRASGFSMDPDYAGRQAMREDYSYSGWDKGHMAPAGDMKWSAEAMRESFYLTNICPQNHELNSKDWHILENHVRDWAVRYGNLFVVCGPIFQAARHGVIGDRRVAVPDAFFKAILRSGDDGYKCIAFVFDNESFRQPVTKAIMSVNQLEGLCGLDLFCNLPDSIEETAEAQASWSDWE